MATDTAKQHDEKPSPTCPGCDHEMDTDEMLSAYGCSESDLFALAPEEGMAVIKCPRCDIEYHCRGGYHPHYTSSFCEDDL